MSKTIFKREGWTLRPIHMTDTVVQESRCGQWLLCHTDTGYSDCNYWWTVKAEDAPKREDFDSFYHFEKKLYHFVRPFPRQSFSSRREAVEALTS